MGGTMARHQVGFVADDLLDAVLGRA
jgi:hypothetical protein